jgi:hypothetical protein
MTNIHSSLPKLNEKIDLLKKIFLQNEKDDVSFDVAEIFHRLLMDMLTTAMFDIDYHTLERDGGEGRLIMKDLYVAVKEMMQKRLSNPFRSFMFWDNEHREGDLAALRLCRSQKNLLDRYRADNTPEEIERRVSIMAQLIKTPYKSGMERCADMTTFMTAG